MSMTLNERNPNVVAIHVGALGAGATATIPGVYLRKHSRIKFVHLVDSVAIAASGTVYVTATLQDNAGSPNAYASGNTKLGVAAFTPLMLTLTSQQDSSAQAVSEEEDVPAGTMLDVVVVSTSTAVLTNAKVLIEYYPL